MKEATGELNMTVITVVAIAAIAAFFYAFIWPAIKNNLARTTYCSSAVCTQCTTSGNKRTCTGCTYVDDEGQTQELDQCVYEDSGASVSGNAGAGS